MRKAKAILAIALFAAGVVALLLLVVLLAWNSVAGPFLGSASLLTLISIFAVGVACLAGGVFLILELRKKR